jgi:hypothetical protein
MASIYSYTRVNCSIAYYTQQSRPLIGVFHEPDRVWGHINAVVMHPATIERIVGRMIRRA